MFIVSPLGFFTADFTSLDGPSSSASASTSTSEACFFSSSFFFFPFITLGTLLNAPDTLVDDFLDAAPFASAPGVLTGAFFSSTFFSSGFFATSLVGTALDTPGAGLATAFLSAATTYVTPPAFILRFKLSSIGSSSPSLVPFFPAIVLDAVTALPAVFNFEGAVVAIIFFPSAGAVGFFEFSVS